MDKPRNFNVTIENAQIIFRNFSGKPSDYNVEGNRNFCVLLSESDAAVLRERGGNVKTLKPREEGDIPQDYIQVAVSYKVKPPSISLVNEKTRISTKLTESELVVVDFTEIVYADLKIDMVFWNRNGRSGFKAYCNTLYITIPHDPLKEKYENALESATECIGPNCPVIPED